LIGNVWTRVASFG